MESGNRIGGRIACLWKSTRKRPWVLAAVALGGAVAVPLALCADSEQNEFGLNQFTPHTVISSSEVNENFYAVGEHMDRYEGAIRIDGNGNVDIGMTDRSAQLEINGDRLATLRLVSSDNPEYDAWLELKQDASNPFNLGVQWGNVLVVRESASQVYVNAPTQSGERRGVGFQYHDSTKMWVDSSEALPQTDESESERPTSNVERPTSNEKSEG